jgi:hypothetical protein
MWIFLFNTYLISSTNQRIRVNACFQRIRLSSVWELGAKKVLFDTTREKLFFKFIEKSIYLAYIID